MVWDERLRSGNLGELDATAEAFADLSGADPRDSSALFNRGLCLAWGGRTSRRSRAWTARSLDAETAFPEAEAAWLLAELLRQGGGAETAGRRLAVQLHNRLGPGSDSDPARASFLRSGGFRIPRTPGLAPGEDHKFEVFEWLDRPLEPELPGHLSAWRLPIVLATVFVNRKSLRLSSPRAATSTRSPTCFSPGSKVVRRSIRREAAPLPLRFQDAALWIFRIPGEVEASSGEDLRGAIEHYFENEWIHLERKGLDGRSPLGAARRRREAMRSAGQAFRGGENARTARQPGEHQGPLQGISVRPLAKTARPGSVIRRRRSTRLGLCRAG